MTDYNELVLANKEIKTKPIKGKNYAEVKERINAFRKLFPTGTIKTEIVNMDEKCVVMKATVGYFNNGSFVVLGTGHAYEFVAKNKNINSTSMIENCETSAVGRALGMCGIGIDVALASYDEMRFVTNTTPEPVPMAEDEATRKSAGEDFLGLCKANNLVASYVSKACGLKGKPSADDFAAAAAYVQGLIDSKQIPVDWRAK